MKYKQVRIPSNIQIAYNHTHLTFTLQFHVSPEGNAALAALGTTVMPYDGIVEWEAEKLEDILELFASEELIKVIRSCR